MSTHTEAAFVQLWTDAARAHRLVRPEMLAAIRFELVERKGLPIGWIDLTFAAGKETHVVPGLLVDLQGVILSDPAALIWPAALTADQGIRDALIDIILPRVNALFRGRSVPGERTIELRPCVAFREARAHGELGAAPLEGALARMAPWIYAGRAMTGTTVRIDGPDTALGAAVLRTFGITVDVPGEANTQSWYERAPASIPAGAPVLGLALTEPSGPGWRKVHVTAPRPIDLPFEFDADDEHAAPFWVREPLVTPASP